MPAQEPPAANETLRPVVVPDWSNHPAILRALAQSQEPQLLCWAKG